jgi:O-antigen ligase
VAQLRGIDLAAFATAALATVLISSDQGGFFERTWPWAGLALAAVGALVLARAKDLRVSWAGVALIAATAAICGWTALSWFWSSDPSATRDEALRAPVYLAAAIAFVAFSSLRGGLGILTGVASGATGIAAYSLVDRLFTPAHGQLLGGPLGYANALGALCVIGLAIVGVLGLRLRTPYALLPAAVLLGALALTASRGSWVALAAGLFVAIGFAAGWGGAAAAVVAIALGALYVVTALATPTRLLQARADYWHVAWHVGVHHPLGGLGAGTYDLAWAAYGDLARWGDVLDAHNLYLETFAELGVVGVVLVLTLAAPVVTCVRRLPGGAASAALAASVTYLVHAGLDWDWEMPAVTVAGIACLAAACPPGNRSVKPLQSTFLAIAGGVILFYGLDVLF